MTLLNIFHLINKSNLFRNKLSKLCLKVAEQKNNQFKVSFVIKIINSYANIIHKLKNFGFQVVLILLKNFHLINNGNLLRTKVPKLCSEIFVYFKKYYNFSIFLYCMQKLSE